MLNTNLYLRCPSLKRRVKVNLTVKDNAERGKVCRDGETDQMFNTSFGNGEKQVIIERKSPKVTPAYGLLHRPRYKGMEGVNNLFRASRNLLDSLSNAQGLIGGVRKCLHTIASEQQQYPLDNELQVTLLKGKGKG